MISYDADAIARLVSFSLISREPRIQRETGESLHTLKAIAEKKRPAPSTVLRYFHLEKDGEVSLWR